MRPRSLWLAAALLLVIGLWTRWENKSEPSSPESFPKETLQVPDWNCVALPASEADYSDSAADAAESWRCYGPESISADVYVGYLWNAGRGRRLKSPAVFYAKSDWGWNSSSKDPIALAPREGETVKCSLLRLRHFSGKEETVLYWYDINGADVPDEWRYRLRLIQSRLTRGPSRVAVVRISALGTHGALDSRSMAELALTVRRHVKSRLL